ncbi:hypothetical protein [Streptomyces fuscichromogenes]|uniref:Uncharacterized protein n=1 Tax=Streptomyces fuscichromogenes TaxID=1324013 RepID=A0A918CRJ1_9ACTN|nr:hypothetical protein [Streptomyces fuscichromogenes]GGN09048.1 hypothetical protein GCM10011578_034170 [Streptomyces fuscichromogenes]
MRSSTGYPIVVDMAQARTTTEDPRSAPPGARSASSAPTAMTAGAGVFACPGPAMDMDVARERGTRTGVPLRKPGIGIVTVIGAGTGRGRGGGHRASCPPPPGPVGF